MLPVFKKISAVVCYGLFAMGANAQEEVENAHVTIENPAELTKEQASKIYDKLKKRMAESYTLAGQSEIKDYQSWTKYNSSPFLSATHGQRFVNNYANKIGHDYGSLKKGQSLPKGTVLAKDSITITADGKTFMGAMFVMEKLAKGTNPKTADWRYIMIIPDGSVYGDTLGSEPDQVQYCHTCHKAKAKTDYIFFVPEDYRVKP